jgi:drug/metabolite transporter (DMT)-like permease
MFCCSSCFALPLWLLFFLFHRTWQGEEEQQLQEKNKRMFKIAKRVKQNLQLSMNMVDEEEKKDDEVWEGDTEALLTRLLSAEDVGETETNPAQHRRGRSLASFFSNRPKRGHKRNQSSLSQFMDSFSGNMSVIAEDFRGVAEDIKDTWVGELKDADEGRTTFLDTGVMRSLSVLPDDLEILFQELRREEAEASAAAAEAAAPTLWNTIAPYFSLFAAVLAISSNSTALNVQTGVSPALKLYWRMTAVALTLCFFALRSFVKDGIPKLNFGQWTTMLLASSFFSTQCLCFVMSLDYTSIGNAVLFSNTQAVILLAGKALTGTPIVWLEAVGAFVAVGGAMLCVTDEQRDDAQTGQDASKGLWGDGLALLSAFLGVGYLTFAKAVRPHLTVLAFMFIMMFSGSFVVMAFMVIHRDPIHFTNDPYHGLFGWMNLTPTRLPVELWIVLVCNLLGTMGFVRAMKYFDSVIIAVATLLEPMMASIIATLKHVGVLPGPQGWIGNLLVLVGTLLVVFPSASKGEGEGSH